MLLFCYVIFDMKYKGFVIYDYKVFYIDIEVFIVFYIKIGCGFDCLFEEFFVIVFKELEFVFLSVCFGFVFGFDFIMKKWISY